jgi:choline monooxygenase
MNQDLLDMLALYDENAPLEYAYTIPAAWYTNHLVANLERERVFGANWIAIGRTDQVAHPGQFFTAQLAGEPLAVVRGSDGLLRAFYNVCRHHAAEVMTEPCGQAEHLRCPYHGWTYALDGSLKGAPEFAGVCNFDRAENGLVPVQVATWQNFVFVNLDPQATFLHTFLGDLADRVSVAGLQFFARKTYTLACNWKVYVDNYLDGGYHVPHLHKSLNSVLDYREYTIANGPNYTLQSSPLVASEDASVAQTRTGDRAEYYWLYPNFMINLYSGVMDTNLVLPLGQDKCQVVFDFYFSEQSEQYKSESVAVSDRVQIEDVDICESVQRGLGSRAYSAGRLSVRRETGEHLFHRLLAKDLKR